MPPFFARVRPCLCAPVWCASALTHTHTQAHTCFNILVLPEYGSEDVLASKIEEAIEHVNDGLLLT